jgi:hypothetical protein
MAKRDAWIHNPRWDAETRADFDARIRRTRAGSSRAHAFIVKARFLWLGGDSEPARHDAALALLARAVAETGGDDDATARVLEELALFQVSAGDREGGIDSLRRSIAAAAQNPRWQSHTAGTLLGRCLVDAGDFAGAIAAFDAFYAGHRRPHYDPREDSAVVRADGTPYATPDDAAESIVTYHHAAEPDEPAVPEVTTGDRASLAALDRHFAITEPRFREPLRRPFHPRTAYTPDFLEQHFVAELGAYLGRVLVKAAGGQWVVRAPLMKSRIKLGAREVNPFRAAFAAVFYEIPLAAALEQLEREKPLFALPG